MALGELEDRRRRVQTVQTRPFRYRRELAFGHNHIEVSRVWLIPPVSWLASCLETTMAFPLPRGVTASEIAFLAEMETVTIVPRQRLEGLELLGVTILMLSLNCLHEIDHIRAPLSLSFLHDAPPFPSGSRFYSNANAVPISCHLPGCTQNH